MGAVVAPSLCAGCDTSEQEIHACELDYELFAESERRTILSDTIEVVDRCTGARKREGLDLEALHSRPSTAHIAQIILPQPRKSEVACVGLEECLPKHVLPAGVITRSMQMSEDIQSDPQEMLDHEWSSCGDALAVILGADATEKQTMAQCVIDLAREARKQLEADSTLMEVECPAHVFGDIHGQFRDLLLFFGDYGFPSLSSEVFVFNGDFVDRGAHQLEVVCLLFSLKIMFPTQIVLLRGNHEDPDQNIHMGEKGFAHVCFEKFGPELGETVFRAVHETFEWLPLSCCIARRILVLHGGIGKGEWDLSYLRTAERPISSKRLFEDLVLYNLLWSDPVPEDQQGCAGVHDSPRDDHKSLISMFGPDVTEAFCLRNNLDVVVRSHATMYDGCGYEVMHSGRCVTVFSARDYEGCQNDGSILNIVTSPLGKLVITPQVQLGITKRMV